MNQQEIKENLPQLPIEPLIGTKEIVDYKGDYLLECNSEVYSSSTDIALQMGIVHAINNTYGKGINPESVSEMYNALKVLSAYFEDGEIYDNIQIILNKASL